MKIEVHIQGITPLMPNRFGDAAAQAASSGTRSSIATTDRGTPLEIADSKLYRDEKGVLVIPVPNIQRSFVGGGEYHKIGKKQVTTKKASLLYACLDIDGTAIPIKHKQPWKVDTRPVVIPATGGKILAHRPMFDDWELRMIINLDLTILSEKLMRQIIDDAGKRVGLADFRPQCKGPYGKYVVVHWKAQAEPIRKAA